ncbi:MAG: PLDc N-terminal domain-containing protein, partial [Oscillospiraceae bacterium]|nr:PLDc N-terminal domain-containing protein [Oscillospiraceae bacterium]
MKKKIIIHDRYGVKEKEIDYIPIRFIIAILLIILETTAVIVITMLCGAYIPYFYIAMWATEIFCVLKIINSEENPDYKIPWLLVTLLIPVAGFMLYFMFYNRKLTTQQVKRINKITEQQNYTDDSESFAILENEDRKAYLQAKLLCRLAHSHLYRNTKAIYFPIGEDMNKAMLNDLQRAEKFIFLEYFIIEEGIFWSGILDILKRKASQGIEVRVVYDDVGCMLTLPGDYYKTLQGYGIKAVRFSPLKGHADNEFNNRNHSK